MKLVGDYMGWTLESAAKETRDDFTAFIRKHKSLLKQKDIYIWGAGVRGTLLGILLEQYALWHFTYLDSDERKWGDNINGHIVLSPESISRRNEKNLILIPIEYPEDVQKRLILWEYKEEEDFFAVRSSEESRYAKDFFRIYGGKRLILGDSFFNEVPLEEENAESVKQLLYLAMGVDQTKILAMNCMGMLGTYHIIRLQIIYGQRPQEVWLWCSFEALTPYHHLLPRAQHSRLMQMIQMQGSITDCEFTEYLQETAKLIKNSAVENQYSPRRTYQDNVEDKTTIQREYMKFSLLYDLEENNMEFIYLKKILHMLREEKVKGYLVGTPINEQLAEKYEPGSFRGHFERNTQILKNIAKDYGFCYVDTRGLLEEKDFLASATINDALRESGRIKLIRFLRERTDMFED